MEATEGEGNSIPKIEMNSPKELIDSEAMVSNTKDRNSKPPRSKAMKTYDIEGKGLRRRANKRTQN
eukprot:293519-Amphidinium_carterae.1